MARRRRNRGGFGAAYYGATPGAKRGGFGAAYNSGPQDTPEPEHHDRGFFGTVKHVATTIKDVPGDFATGANRFAHQAVPGIELGIGAVKHDVGASLRSDWEKPYHGFMPHPNLDNPFTKRLPGEGGHTYQLAQASYEGVKHDARHPLADPFSTLFDIFSIAAPVAKVGAVGVTAGRAAKAGDLGAAGRALVTPRPTPPSRVYTWQNKSANLPASRNPIVHLAQRKVIDPLRHRFPNTPVIGEAPTVGRIGNRDRRYLERQANAQGVQLVMLGRKAGMLQRKGRVGTVTFDALARQNALRLVAEETSPALRARRHQVWLAERDPRMNNPVRSRRKNPLIAEAADAQAVSGHRFQIKLNEATARYVDENANFTPEAKAIGLDKVYAQAERLGLARELAFGDLASLGVKPLSEEAMAGRVSAPGKLYRGADYVEPPKTKGGVVAEPDWLLRARGGVAKLQKRYDQAAARAATAGEQQVAKLNERSNGGGNGVAPGPFAKPRPVGNGATAAETLPQWAQQDAAYLAAKRADIEHLTQAGVSPDDSRWISLVSSAGRSIKWHKFPSKRAAIVDWFENHVAPGYKRKVDQWRSEQPSAPVDEMAVARARLTVLEQRHAAFQQRLEEHMLNKQAKLDKGQQAEQRARNTKNGKIARRDAGVNSQGNAAGYVGKHRGVREQSVNDELRAQAEAEFEKLLAAHPDNPAVKTLLAERAEMDRLRAVLEPDPETLFERSHTPAPAETRVLPVKRDEVTGRSYTDLPTDEYAGLMPKGEHVYHSTDAEALAGVRRYGLRPGKVRPGEPTGVYFAEDGAGVISLRPARARGGDILLRARRDSLKTEATDMFEPGSGFEELVSRERVPPQALEYLGADNQWHRLAEGPLPKHLSTDEAHALIGRLVTGPGKAVPAKGTGAVELLGGALAIAKHQLDLAEHRWALRQAKPTGWVGSDFEGGRMRVPAAVEGKSRKMPQTSVGSTGAANATPPRPASLTQHFRGLAYKMGIPRNDVLALLHENWQEAQRYVTLLHALDELKATSSPIRRSKHDILMRVEKIEGQLPLQDAVAVAEEAARDDTFQARLAMQFEDVRQRVFPDTADGAAYKTLEPGVPYKAPAGYEWVDKRLLGGLNHSNPMLSAYRHGTVRGAVNVWDTVNNASKLAILFLKPAYIPPNLVGNIGMLLTEQGFAAPKNLARAAFANAYASADDLVKADAAMGEGTFTVLGADGGHLAGAVQGLARGFGKLVDVVPRRAAFFHEAELEGYGVPARFAHGKVPSSPHAFGDLFQPGHEEALARVTQRANAQIIDYGDLSSLERHIIRRAIFFYPWVKGATRWTVRWMTEHPGQVAVLNALGRPAEEHQREVLGPDLPTWAEGLVPMGEKGGLPTTVNPVGLTTLGTAADVLRASSALLHGGNRGAAESVSGFLPPAARIAGEIPSKGVLGATVDQAQNFPPVTALGLGRDSATFPAKNTPEERLLQWLLSGSFAPRQTSPPALARSARNQKRK